MKVQYLIVKNHTFSLVSGQYDSEQNGPRSKWLKVWQRRSKWLSGCLPRSDEILGIILEIVQQILGVF